MKDIKQEYRDLHGSEFETVIHIAETYGTYLSNENLNAALELKRRQADFDKSIKTLTSKKFIVVFGERNKNRRLVRKYTSAKYYDKLSSIENVVNSFSFRCKTFFMEMPEKDYDKFNLEENLRYLPGVPSTILELEATKLNYADDASIVFILGPDAEYVKNFFECDNIAMCNPYSSYKNVKVQRTPAAQKIAAFELPLFKTDDGMKTYSQCVEEGYVMQITKGNENYVRALDKSTSIWEKEDISDVFNSIRMILENSSAFDKKVAQIKVGDYRRLIKYIKNTKEFPTWDEYLTNALTTNSYDVQRLFDMGARRTVKNATSLFASYTEANLKAARNVIAKEFNGKATPKQEQFISDLQVCCDVYKKSSGSYKARNFARTINYWLSLNLVDPNDLPTNEIDLQLDTKYPWVDILNTYYCDNEASMKFILEIVDRY